MIPYTRMANTINPNSFIDADLSCPHYMRLARNVKPTNPRARSFLGDLHALDRYRFPGLVVGIANENSIAWGCAKAFRAFGAELAITYLNDKAKKYVEPLARELEAPILMPLDTNVLRVQQRTEQDFDHECAQALFDLGREICLARVPRCGRCPLAAECPARGSRYEPGRKQGPFEGSFRQKRAHVLRLVAEAPRSLGELDAEAVRSLAGDGLVSVRDGLARLPE